MLTSNWPRVAFSIQTNYLEVLVIKTMFFGKWQKLTVLARVVTININL